MPLRSKTLLVQVSPAPVVGAPTKLSAPPPNTMRPALAEVLLSRSTERMRVTPSLRLALPVKVESVPAEELKLMRPLPAFVKACRAPDAEISPATDQSPPPCKVKVLAAVRLEKLMFPVIVFCPLVLLVRVVVPLLAKAHQPKEYPYPLRPLKTSVAPLVAVVRRKLAESVWFIAAEPSPSGPVTSWSTKMAPVVLSRKERLRVAKPASASERISSVPLFRSSAVVVMLAPRAPAACTRTVPLSIRSDCAKVLPLFLSQRVVVIRLPTLMKRSLLLSAPPTKPVTVQFPFP